jgi:hypothetical protein
MVCTNPNSGGKAIKIDVAIGVGKLPTMGYDTYNAFEGDFDGALALEQARLMHEHGLVAAGYNVSKHDMCGCASILTECCVRLSFLMISIR